MRFLAVLALLAACTVQPAPVAPGPSSPTPVQHAVAQTVFLAEAGCTGVRVGDNLVVTAKHCVDDDAAPGDAFAGGVLVHVSPAHDFAVARVDGLEPPVFIRMRAGELGEHVYVVGYPVQLGSGDQALTITDGLVAGPVDEDRQARITAPVYFGNSGGGVWADDGSLVGIAVAVYAVHVDGSRPLPYVAQSFMVPVEYVYSVLRHL